MTTAMLAAAPNVTAQSSHLTSLELSAPAAVPEPVGAVAFGGWASIWMAPAGGGKLAGVPVGLEHSGFAAMTTAFVATRVRVGGIWQLSFSQTRVTDLFDNALLEAYPELADLRAAASMFGIDWGTTLPLGAAFSIGGRLERDEFLGDAATAWMVRVSGRAPTIAGVRSAMAAEKIAVGGALTSGPGRLRAGIARDFERGPIMVTLGVGGLFGSTWRRESSTSRLAGALRVTLFSVLSVFGAMGAEKDEFGTEGWLGFSSVGIGLTLGAIGVDLRRGGMNAPDAAPIGVSIRYAPN